MPVEKDVQERKYWWCPKWYWPFAVCSGIRTVHKWCYNFAWIKSTGYLFATYYEACEDGVLHTWLEPFGGVGSSPAKRIFGEMCFNSSRSRAGRCDPSNTGLEASGLSASDHLASNFAVSITSLESVAFEHGTFEFTPENGGLCRVGAWPWKRTLHSQKIVVSVDTRFATINWYVGGMLLNKASGTIQVYCLCAWPFPLPSGRSHNQVVDISYEVIMEHNKSSIILYNNKFDGCFSVPVEMQAFDNGKMFTSNYTLVDFKGETCDFDPKQVADMAACLDRVNKLFQEETKSRKPLLGEPAVEVSPEISQHIAPGNKKVADLLISIIKNTSKTHPDKCMLAFNQLEFELTMPGRLFDYVQFSPKTWSVQNCCKPEIVLSTKKIATILVIGVVLLGLYSSLVRRKRP